jgi:RNA polymerase sigma factor (sigma-70 family)
MLTYMSDNDTGLGGEALSSREHAGIDVDQQIDRSFAQGGDAELRAVYERYSSLVFTFCRRSLAADPAADAAQETFVSAWRSRESYDPSKGSVAGWLMGIARFKVIEQLRRGGRDSGSLEAPPNGVPETTDINLERIADRMLLAEALDQLAPRVRTVVELAFLNDLTQIEIAERCSLPLGTVKSDLRRGVERLRRHLSSPTGGVQ